MSPESEAPPQPEKDRSRGRGVVLRFGLLFLLLVAGFHLVFYLWFSKSSAFATYLAWNAEASGLLLRLLGQDVRVVGSAIQSPDFSVEVRRGCDAIQPAAIFLSGVLSFPARWRSRLWGALAGTAILLTLNLVRIASLFWIGVVRPEAFETFHVEVWQVGFIFLALLLWVLWLRVAVPPGSSRKPDVATSA